MRVTVLGKSPSWPDAGGACSGYLVQEGATTILLDCGNGVFAKLRERLDYLDVDALVLTHMHADHWLDAVAFANALTYSPRQSDPPLRPRLIAPPGAAGVFREVLAPIKAPDLFENAFRVTEHDGAGPVSIGPLSLTFHRVPHFIETWAVRFESEDTPNAFVFGADCGPSDALVEAARDAALVFVEGTVTEPDDSEPPGHMTPREAGEQARLAGARRAVITHFTDEVDPEWARVEAEAGFGGPVELAAPGEVYEV